MRLLLFLLGLLLLAACGTDFDPADRRRADQDEYALLDQTCAVEGDRAVARGRVRSHADEPQQFGVVVRFFDGEVDLGRPQNVNGSELVEPGSTWSYEANVELDGERPTDLRCDVIQVVIGDDVDH